MEVGLTRVFLISVPPSAPQKAAWESLIDYAGAIWCLEFQTVLWSRSARAGESSATGEQESG